MKNDRENQIKACDEEINAAGNMIDKKQYSSSVESLLQITKDHHELILSSPYLEFGANSLLGLGYYHLHNYEKAIEHFNVAISIKESAENTLFMRAKCYDYLDRFEEAKADYERVIELNPVAENSHAFLGLLLENEGFLEEAKKRYLEALEVDEGDTWSAERLDGLRTI